LKVAEERWYTRGLPSMAQVQAQRQGGTDYVEVGQAREVEGVVVRDTEARSGPRAFAVQPADVVTSPAD
jgi:predicted extracellular nuclease